jgi:hypothetical protein
MIKAIRPALLAAPFIFLSLPALGECRIGDGPEVPDGWTAQPAEMTAAQAAIKAYILETQDFLTCLEAEAKGNFTPEITARYNEATGRMSSLSMQLNAALQNFKQRG